MSPEIIDEISVWVRTGAYTREQLVEFFCEFPRDEVSSTVAAAFRRILIEQSTWPPRTDCNKLDEAFLALNSQGIISLQNVGFDREQGHEACVRSYEDPEETPDKDSIAGYCFYHGTNLRRAIEGLGLCLEFGSFDPKHQQTKGAKIGRMIKTDLENVAFSVEWNGDPSHQICIPRILWRRRLNEVMAQDGA